MDKIKEFVSKNRKAVIALCAVVIAAAAGTWYYVSSRSSEDTGEEEKVYSVRTETIGATGNDVYLSYAGLIQPEKTEQATISVIGDITDIYVDQGDDVVAGQVLFKVDSSTYERERDTAYETMRSAEYARDSAKSSSDRAYASYQDALRLPTREEKTAAEDNYNKAKEKVSDLNYQISYIDGEVEKNSVREQGDFDDAQRKYEEAKTKYEEAVQSSAGNTEELKRLADEALKERNEKEAELNNKKAEEQVKAETYIGKSKTALQSELAQAEAEQERTRIIYENTKNSRTVSQGEIDSLKSRYESASHSYESAEHAYQSAKSSYDRAVERVEDCSYKAGMDGTIVMKISEEGGIATPLNPVVVIGSHSLIAQFGISQVDIKDISEGMEAVVTIEGQQYTGRISSIALMPDETTRTYTTDVVLDNASEDLYLGELASVRINIGERDGIWLPLSVIMNDGQDYVFTVSDSRVVRKNVSIQDISDDYVMVTGLSEGDRVITEGMKTVKSGNLVNVING